VQVCITDVGAVGCREQRMHVARHDALYAEKAEQRNATTDNFISV
jgi:hypothetical protein